VPRASLTVLARRPDVRAIEAAPEPNRRAATGLGLSTAAVGAPSWWAARFSGGRGTSDVSPVDLAIVSDKIQQDHPAFAGVTFQTPPGQGASGSDHGTAAASMAISRGATGCTKCVADDADRKGIAPGLDTVLDASLPTGSASVWALGISQTLSNGTQLAGASDPAEVLSDSHGTANPTQDDDMSLQGTDITIATFGATIAYPAGNSGPARSVEPNCIAYNTICTGAYRHFGTEDPSDDVMADFSSRGPTPGGRKKPDLVAIGVTMYADRLWADPTHGLWEGRQDGTSWAAPQAAGAAALVAGSGITDPVLQKAILLNSTRLGRATPSDPMGTQTSWQPDWGWGALNLQQALAERTNGASGSVPGASARFYRATSVASGDRATLAWQRRGTNACYTGHCIPAPLTLTNLDLQQLDPPTGAVQAQSNSAIDNVEQVRSPGAAATAIYKVKATSSVDGLAAEPFAVTAARPLTPLATPQPAVTLDVAAGVQRPQETATVTATVRNPSADLTAENASVTLQLPVGVDLVNGAQTRSLGTLPTSSPTQTFTWTVIGSTDGVKAITASAQASRYGETFTGTATDSFTVDATGPAPTIAAPRGETRERSLAVAWGATDAYSGVARYDLETSADYGGWTRWLTGTTTTNAIYLGAAGHRYRFRVRATDTLGNTSAWVESTDAKITDETSSPPTGDNTQVTTKSSPRLTLASVKRGRAGIAVAGRIDSAATGGVTITYSTTAGRKTLRARRYASLARGGRFRASLPLGAKARSTRRGTVAITYRGDTRFAPQTLTRVVVAR
jgi:hypothetical protein